MDKCREVFEEGYDPPGPDPEPVVAPTCEKTADCGSGETCCVYNYQFSRAGFDITGMGVGCLSDYYEWDCLEEFAVEDIVPPAPEPVGPTAPDCPNGTSDCDEGTCCYYSYTDLEFGNKISGMAVGCIVDDGKCLGEYEPYTPAPEPDPIVDPCSVGEACEDPLVCCKYSKPSDPFAEPLGCFAEADSRCLEVVDVDVDPALQAPEDCHSNDECAGNLVCCIFKLESEVPVEVHVSMLGLTCMQSASSKCIEQYDMIGGDLAPPEPEPVNPNKPQPLPNAALTSILISICALLVIIGCFCFSKWLSGGSKSDDPAAAKRDSFLGETKDKDLLLGPPAGGINESGDRKDSSISMDFAEGDGSRTIQ